MKKFKEYVIFKTNFGYYQVFKDDILICRFNAFLNLTHVYKRISIIDLKEIIIFLQNE